MGLVAQCHVLVHACNLGNKSCGLASNPDHLACSHNGGAGGAAFVAVFRTAVGSRRIEQYFPALVPSILGVMDLLSQMEMRKTVCGRNVSCVRSFLCTD